MIESYKDYKYYLLCDEIARFGGKAKFMQKLKQAKMWEFNCLLRKMEYNQNCRGGYKKKLLSVVYKLRMRRLSSYLGWYIGTNTFGPGLCVVHIGPVIVNGHTRFGANCRIQAMVNIGGNGDGGHPVAGDNIYIGPGAKIFGEIKLGNNIAIGANAVVNKSFEESNVTLAGVPAKIVANRGCEKFVVDSRDIAKLLNS